MIIRRNVESRMMAGIVGNCGCCCSCAVEVNKPNCTLGMHSTGRHTTFSLERVCSGNTNVQFVWRTTGTIYTRERGRGGTQRESAAREVHNNSSIRIAVHEAHTRESYFIIITKRSQEDYD